MNASNELLRHLLHRLRQVQRALGCAPTADDDTDARLGEQLDSMALVEFIALLADDCGVPAAAIEASVGQQFGSVRELAAALARAGLAPRTLAAPTLTTTATPPARSALALGWLSGVTLTLPEEVQPAEEMDALLRREPGWLVQHAGIHRRHVWRDQDPLAVATATGRTCLDEAGLLPEEVGALLVTSEAPPLLAGLAAALHHRLDLRPEAVALEVGGACTGFLAAVWLTRALLSRLETVLILCLEAPSLHLTIQPGPSGEAAALFGDAAAACVLSREGRCPGALPVRDIRLRAHGAAGDCLRVEPGAAGRAEVHMDGPRLAGLAVNLMAEQLRDLAGDHRLAWDSVQAVIAHGGNGRMSALLARRLGLPELRVWSQTAATGNLGSASLPAAWAAHRDDIAGPILWAAAGAGLTAAVAITGARGSEVGERLDL